MLSPFDAQKSEARRRVVEGHAAGLELVTQLTNQAVQEVVHLNGRESNPATQFQLVVLGQSINSTWSAMELIESGFARQAVFLFRLLREGHIAILWAYLEPDQAGAWFEKVRQEMHLQRGPWPSAGSMAKKITAEFEAENAPAGTSWVVAMRAIGDTHNEVFTHAVSDFSLSFGFDADGKNFEPVRGPTYDQQLTEIAINHLVALAQFVLNDAAVMVTRVLRRRMSPQAEALVDRAGDWLRAHPLPVLTGGRDALHFDDAL